MHSPPQPRSPAATPLADLSPTTTMPRVSFSLRPSLSRPLSPPWPARGLLYSGDVWLPNEPSFFSFGFGSKWTKTSLALWLDHIVDSASALPLLHLRLGDHTAVVVTGVHKHRAVTAECGNANGATAKKRTCMYTYPSIVKAILMRFASVASHRNPTRIQGARGRAACAVVPHSSSVVHTIVLCGHGR
jgi:hypothetical protein